jgi:ABC-2 type transport system permease protein
MKVLTITGTTMRRIVRDRTSLFFIVLLPFLIIMIIGTATAGFSDNRVPVGITGPQTGTLTQELVRALEHSPVMKLQRVASVDDLRKGVRRGIIAAGIAIPDDYETRARRGERVNVGFVVDIARTPAVVRGATTAAVAGQGALLQAAGFATSHTDRTFDANLKEARKVAGLIPAVGVRTVAVGKRSEGSFIMSGFSYTAPSQIILFVFITSLAGAGMGIQARQLGISRRMLGTPTTAWTLIAGETLARFSLALFQAVYILVLGIAVFGVNFGNPLGAFTLVALFALVGTAFAMLASTVFRTPEQAGSIGPPVGIAMGMLAGCMWPRFIMPMPMQRLGQLFPHAWAMDAFIKLIARNATFTDILPQLGVLAAFVVVLLPLATWRLHRAIVA